MVPLLYGSESSNIFSYLAKRKRETQNPQTTNILDAGAQRFFERSVSTSRNERSNELQLVEAAKDDCAYLAKRLRAEAQPEMGKRSTSDHGCYNLSGFKDAVIHCSNERF